MEGGRRLRIITDLNAIRHQANKKLVGKNVTDYKNREMKTY